MHSKCPLVCERSNYYSGLFSNYGTECLKLLSSILFIGEIHCDKALLEFVASSECTIKAFFFLSMDSAYQ